MYSDTNFSDFNPRIIPYQSQVIDFLDEWDYSTGTPEILLSGSYGSAKSILMAHLAVRHCLENPGARVCIARKALPDLKDTIYNEIIEHIEQDFTEGVHYWTNETSAKIRWNNGSEIISKTWADKKYKKGRSLKLSMLIVEEISENNDDDKEAFMTLKARLRRIPKVKENILICATNPDGPSHWVYKYFILDKKRTRKVFYSNTKDNPFLDPIYIEQLKEDLDPRAARRYLHGEWIELTQEVIYYAYNSEKQFLKKKYEVNEKYPVTISFDFNIGVGKPMSSCAYQHINDEFHVFKQVVIHGSRTQDVMEEYNNAGIFKPGRRIIVHGDATGKARHTNSIHSDYDIIVNYLAKITGITYELQVPMANPPIRSRHNKVNAYCLNDNGKTRLWIYEGCETVDEALRLTQFKKGADLVEDDSKAFQHIGTALGYGLYYDTNKVPGLKYTSTKG